MNEPYPFDKTSDMPEQMRGSSPSVTSSVLGTTPGITLKDIREFALKHPRVPKLSWVRVSDGWWVAMENDKPTAFMPHGDLMRVIEEHCRPVGQHSH